MIQQRPYLYLPQHQLKQVAQISGIGLIPRTNQITQELNNLTTTTLHKGQILKIFPAKSEPPVVKGLATYQVRRGDSPFLIAQRHQMPLDRLLYLNQLYPGSTIYPGQKLYIE